MLHDIFFKFNGTFIDCAGLALSASLGTLLGRKIPEKIQGYVMQALGLACIMLGVCGILDINNALFCIVSLVVGSVIGHSLSLETNLEKVLNRLVGKFSGTALPPRFVEGLIGYTLMSITGSMAISGPIENALEGRTEILMAKLILDVTAGFFFAASYGVPVICSALLVGVYQCVFGVLAVGLSTVMTDALIADMGAVGSVLIFMLGMNLAGSGKVSTMNYTPCIFIPILLHLIFG